MGHKVLPVGFQPSEYDVVCGRGKGSYLQPGNVKFRSIIASCSKDYITVSSKTLKTTFIDQIIEKVRMQNHGNARFVKQLGKGGLWVELDEAETRDKVGHSVRAELVQIYGRSVQAPQPSPIVQQKQKLLSPRRRRSMMTTTQTAQVASADCCRFEKMQSFNIFGSWSTIAGTESPTTTTACIDPFGSHIMTASNSSFTNTKLLMRDNNNQDDTLDYAATQDLAWMMPPIPFLTPFSSSSLPDCSTSTTMQQDDTLMQIPIHDPFPLHTDSSCFLIFDDDVPFSDEDFFPGSDDILDSIDNDVY